MDKPWIIYKNKPESKKYYATIIDGEKVTNFQPLMILWAFLAMEDDLIKEDDSVE